MRRRTEAVRPSTDPDPAVFLDDNEIEVVVSGGKQACLAVHEKVALEELGRTVVSVPAHAHSAQRFLTLEAFSDASGVPASLIQAVEREGIRLGRRVDGGIRTDAA